tara:strand:- start:101 stop:328 length:228 start_codon:yes stop_codon:yes gene_type:complete
MINDKFICPNCEKTEIEDERFVSLAGPSKDNPWGNVSQIVKCGSCKKDIPAHLGYRWDQIKLEDAKQEYLDKYQR